MRFTAPADGEYFLRVRDHLNQGAAHYVYRIEVTPVEPRVTLGLVEREQFVDVTLPVPRGNRVAAMVSAQREDFEGELKIDLKNLPPGIAVETIPMPADQTVVPVLLSAAADAKPCGSLVDVIGVHASKDRTIEGRLEQRTLLVRGQNNREVWSHRADRMATAVTESVPFRIDIVEPKVPLVQSGSMALKVVAKREELKGPITLHALWSAGGVLAASVPLPEEPGPRRDGRLQQAGHLENRRLGGPRSATARC